MNPTARTNLLWAELLVEECVRSGVTDFFIAPGSRSTPLVMAVAGNERVTPHVHYDERGTAFAALGYARATGRPAAWLTTSGTAVANGLPAVVEAASDGVPMLLLTADRPPELRKSGANQTVDQPGIFGGYVRWEFDAPPPDPSVDPASLLTAVDQALRRAPAGPVHLNLMFREPLIPEPGDDPQEIPEHLQNWHASDEPYTRYPTPRPIPQKEEIRRFAAKLQGIGRGVISAGRLRSRAEGEAAVSLAAHLGWPLFADVGSQVRFGGEVANQVTHYDLCLTDGRFTARNPPEAVVHLGSGAVSKRLGQFIAGSRPGTMAVVREDPSRLDPNHIVSDYFESGVVEFCEAIVNASDPAPPVNDWLSGWLDASERVAAVIAGAEPAPDDVPSEPFVARAVVESLPGGSGLVVASSLPVRDVDSYAGSAAAGHIPVAVNRGASGIDGTVATAAGFCIGLEAPVTLLVGDLALLHDLNSLAMLGGLPLTVVVVNNDGGGIFSMLPVARHEGFFERYFGTPHGLGFEDAARMFGLGYERPETMKDFRGVYRKMTAAGEPGIIEIRTSRESGVELRRRLAAEIASL